MGAHRVDPVRVALVRVALALVHTAPAGLAAVAVPVATVAVIVLAATAPVPEVGAELGPVGAVTKCSGDQPPGRFTEYRRRLLGEVIRLPLRAYRGGRGKLLGDVLHGGVV
jgi:hypothetical protein